MRKGLAALAAALSLAGILLAGCVTQSENRPPTAVFQASANAVNVGQQVIFDAGNSTDRDGKIIRYNWDFGDSGQDLGVSVVHSFAAGGIFRVTLTVTDNEGKKDRANMTVQVNEYPRARIGCPAPHAKVLAPIAFSASNSSDQDGTIASCLWDFGDGVNTTGMQVSHAYQDAGTFTVNLTVTDDFGARNSNAMEVTVMLRNYTVGWAIVPGTIPAVSDHSAENSTINKTVSLGVPNMTLASFRLTWKDDIPHWLLGAYNDDFGMNVVDPANNTQALRDLGGNITLNFTLADPPSPFSLSARTEAEAMAQVGGKYSKGIGVGDWLVTVDLGEAGGAQEITGMDLDTGNNWKLDVTYFVYEMVVAEN